MDFSDIKIKMTGSVGWPSPDEMRITLKDKGIDSEGMSDVELIEAYKKAMSEPSL